MSTAVCTWIHVSSIASAEEQGLQKYSIQLKASVMKVPLVQQFLLLLVQQAIT